MTIVNEEGVLSGWLGAWTIFQDVFLVWFRVFCVFGIVDLTPSALSAQVELVSVNQAVPVNYARAEGIFSGTALHMLNNTGFCSVMWTFMLGADPPMNVRASENTNAEIADIELGLEPSTGVLIIGSFALLVWVQRLRKYWG
jgi:hypothetical protein